MAAFSNVSPGGAEMSDTATNIVDVSTAAEVPNHERELVASTLRVVTLIWIGVGILSLAGFAATDPDVVNPRIPGAQAALLTCVAVAAVVLVLALVARVISGSVLVLTMAITALASILLTRPVDDGVVFALSIQWATMAAFCAALQLQYRWAWRVITLTTFAAIALITLRLTAAGLLADSSVRLWHGPTDLAHLMLDPIIAAVDAIGVGMGTATAVRAWRRLAADRDAATDEVALALANAQIARERADYLRHLIYGLHDTVINTLGAVQAGVDPGQVDRVAPRAQHDLRQMAARIAGHDPDADELRVRDLLDCAREQAERLHVEIHARLVLDSDGGTGPVVPQRVLLAMRDCLNEAILNVSKHAPAAQCIAVIDRSGTDLVVTVADDGPGSPSGGGGSLTLVKRATANGIRVSDTGITTSGTAGTLSGTGAPTGEAGRRTSGTGVRFRWSPPTLDATPSVVAALGEESIASSLTAMVTQIVAWIGGSYLLSSLLSVLAGAPASELLPVALGAGLAVLSAVASRRRFPAPPAVVIALIVGVPMILGLSVVGGDLCGVSGTTFPLASWAALLAVITILLSGHPWQGVAASAIYVVGNGALTGIAIASADCGSAFTANYLTDCAGLLAVALFRRRITTYFSEAAISTRLTRAAQDEAGRTQEQLLASAARTTEMLARSRELLTRLADGSADPLDPAVRLAARSEEQYLRSIVPIDPGLGPLADELLAVTDLARRREVRADITVLNTEWAPRPMPTVGESAGVGAALAALIRACPPGTRMRITVAPDDPDWLAIVVQRADLSPDAAVHAIGENDLAISVTALHGQTLIEVRTDDSRSRQHGEPSSAGALG